MYYTLCTVCTLYHLGAGAAGRYFVQTRATTATADVQVHYPRDPRALVRSRRYLGDYYKYRPLPINGIR